MPRTRLTGWTFRVWGLVDQPQEWSYEQFLALAETRVECDMHCVTRWSKYDNVFEGVPFLTVAARVQPKAEARYVMVHAENGFTTNLPLADLMRDADAVRPQAQRQRAGAGPRLAAAPGRARPVLWKSAKWVRGLELLDEDAARVLGELRLSHARRSVEGRAVLG